MNWLGDAVMALPALDRLRASRPAARLSLLTAAKLADLFTAHPAIDRVIPFGRDEGAWTVARRLRGQFDLAVILPNSFRSAWEAWLAGIPQRVGYRGNARSFLLTQGVARPAGQVRMRQRPAAEVRRRIARGLERETFPTSAHHLHSYLHLVAALGCDPTPLAPKLVVTESEQLAFRAKFSIPSGRILLGLNPGAEFGPAKRWPVENFIAAARLVSSAVDCAWLVFGGPADRPLAAEIARGLPGSTDLAGRTTLRELCAGLSLCETVLTNDTGPMHLAAAAGARVVVPFGSTSPELTGPGLPQSARHQAIPGRAACAPCFRRTCPVDFRCLRSIDPKTVAEAILSP